MARIVPNRIISHWDRLLDDACVSPQTFYTALEDAIHARNLAELQLRRVIWHERGFFSAQREYLQVTRDTLVFVLSAFPVGRALFVSWWLGRNERGLAAWLSHHRLFGWLLRPLFWPMTFYRADSALAFQHHMHNAVLAVADQVTAQTGTRKPDLVDQKPIMLDFLVR